MTDLTQRHSNKRFELYSEGNILYESIKEKTKQKELEARGRGFRSVDWVETAAYLKERQWMAAVMN